MNVAVAAGHERTAETALEILRDGGNAFDAAMAAYLVSFVTEPCMSSGGGGAFANIVTADGKAILYDFFCQTPKSKRPADETDIFPVIVDFGDEKEVFHVGLGSSAVPGSIAGILDLHEHYGTIPLTTLVQPAIEAASKGVTVNAFQHLDLELLEAIFRVDVAASGNFFKNGKLLEKGDVLYMPGLADFLVFLSKEGKDAFYKGEIASRIADDHRKRGGNLTKEDLADYKVIRRKPLRFNYKGKTILTNPPPSLGGALLVVGLNMVKDIDFKSKLTKDHLANLETALKKMASVSEPDKLMQAINEITSGAGSMSASDKRGNTTHISIADKWGNALALTTTTGEGCGYFIDGTNIQMNNMLGETALLPNGLHSWMPNTRLGSMMTPTIVLDEKGKVELVMGSGGASRIPSAIMQVIINIADFNMDVVEAVELPRAYLYREYLNVEPGFDNYKPASPVLAKYWKNRSLFFGGVHTLYRSENGWTAAGDQRRDGIALTARL